MLELKILSSMTYYVSKTFILFQNKLAYLLGLNV